MPESEVLGKRVFSLAERYTGVVMGKMAVFMADRVPRKSIGDDDLDFSVPVLANGIGVIWSGNPRLYGSWYYVWQRRVVP